MHQRTKKRTDYGPWAEKFGRFLFRLSGWTLIGQKPDVPKCVIIASPHSTNWDLYWTLAASMALRLPAVFSIKDFWFFWPMGSLMRWLGGIPINRRVRTNTVEQLVQAFDESDRLNMVIPPEGTRKASAYWKTGFYWIADGAQVPIIPGYIDYKRKVLGVGDPFYTTGDLAADFERLQDFYEEKVGIRGKLRPADLEKAAARLAEKKVVVRTEEQAATGTM